MKRDGESAYGAEYSDKTISRVLKKLQLTVSTTAETTTDARKREESDILNFITSGAIVKPIALTKPSLTQMKLHTSAAGA